MSESPVDPVQALAGWMRDAKSVPTMTGAGASTESGATPGVPLDMPEIVGNTALGKHGVTRTVRLRPHAATVPRGAPLMVVSRSPKVLAPMGRARSIKR